MKFQYFTDKIIWRIIIVHIFAIFFTILAAKQFAELNDIEIIKLLDKYGAENSLKELRKEPDSASRIAYYLFWKGISEVIGLLIGFVISLILFIKKKMFWLNALIVFIVGLSFIKIGVFKNQIIYRLFFSFDDLFPNVELQYKFVINGTILLLFALFLFFNKWTSNFALNYSMRKESKMA